MAEKPEKPEKPLFNTFFNENRTYFTLIALFAGLSSYIFSFYNINKNETLLFSIVSLYFFVAFLTFIIYYKTLQYIVDFNPKKIFQKALLFLIISFLMWAIMNLGIYFYSEFYQNFADLSYMSFIVFVYILTSGFVLFIAHKIPSKEGCETLKNILFICLILATIIGISFILSSKKFDSSVYNMYFAAVGTIFMSIIYVKYRILDFKKPINS